MSAKTTVSRPARITPSHLAGRFFAPRTRTARIANRMASATKTTPTTIGTTALSLVLARLDEVGRVLSESWIDLLQSEAGCLGQRPHRFQWLEVRIESNLGDREPSSGHERVVRLLQRRRSIV